MEPIETVLDPVLGYLIVVVLTLIGSLTIPLLLCSCVSLFYKNHRVTEWLLAAAVVSLCAAECGRWDIFF